MTSHGHGISFVVRKIDGSLAGKIGKRCRENLTGRRLFLTSACPRCGEREFLLDCLNGFWQKVLRNGDVAQLGERLNGIQEAKSSILFISTRNFKELWHKAITPFFIFLSCCASFVPVFIRKRRNFFCRFLGYRALPTELHPRFFIQEKKK